MTLVNINLFIYLISTFLFQLETSEDLSDAVAIGIDLGTTYSCVAYFNTITHQVEILEDIDAQEITPSQVVLEEPGFFYVGWLGWNFASKGGNLPQKLEFCLKRWVFASNGGILPRFQYVKRVEFCLIILFFV